MPTLTGNADACGVLRIYDTVRAAHLERMNQFRPSMLVYRARSYDFEEGELTANITRRAGRLRTMAAIVRTRPAIVELNEPGQLNAWPSTLLYTSLIRFLNMLKLRRTRIVFYAIENADTLANLRTYRFLNNRLLIKLMRVLYVYLINSASRVAFGTTSAMRQYQSSCPDMKPETKLFVALPAANGSCKPKEQLAIFVGSFEERKGITKLMGAWPWCEGPGRRLILAGKGPLESEVAVWAHSRADVEVVIDPPRLSIWKMLEQAKVLVLFSQPEVRWREQLGLPITEGLSFGCEIVTSSESGLAAWLTASGHRVLSASATPMALASSIDAALESPRSPQEILASLPATDGRVEADHWLTR